jgi:hypothetical protein
MVYHVRILISSCLNSFLTKAITKKASDNHLCKSTSENLFCPILAILLSKYQLLTYIVIFIDMPSNDFQYQGLGNWVHQKKMKKKKSS